MFKVLAIGRNEMHLLYLAMEIGVEKIGLTIHATIQTASNVSVIIG